MLFLPFVKEETTTSDDKRQKINNLLQILFITNNRINKSQLKIIASTKSLKLQYNIKNHIYTPIQSATYITCQMIVSTLSFI